MIRVLAASVPVTSIPFGAAHRVNFDNPPLKGSCRALLSALTRKRARSATCKKPERP
jgi:hypothetical protein